MFVLSIAVAGFAILIVAHKLCELVIGRDFSSKLLGSNDISKPTVDKDGLKYVRITTATK